MKRARSAANITESEREQIRITIAGLALPPPAKAEMRGAAWQLREKNRNAHPEVLGSTASDGQ